MRILITGGCGFIGTNLVFYFLRKFKKDCEIVIVDNLSRKGSEINCDLLSNAAFNFEAAYFEKIVARDLPQDISFWRNVIDSNKPDVIIHTAAQVAVTTSVDFPLKDFAINAGGTLAVLEAARLARKKPIFIFTSTNKVYGSMDDMEVSEKDTRYEYKNNQFGISEKQNLDFHSPYGCSKGSADQYARDYCRIYDLPTIVFRQSCIYGPHQFGIADQGWIAYLAMCALADKTITIYGNGKQVRDVLYVYDLSRAFDLAINNIAKTKGQIYNIGGGPDNTISVLELIEFMENFFHKKIKVKFADWRPGDQKVYISDVRKAEKDFGWKPAVSFKKGFFVLCDWIIANV